MDTFPCLLRLITHVPAPYTHPIQPGSYQNIHIAVYQAATMLALAR